MLTKGNSKTGTLVWGFSIIAGLTCPGKSEICDTRCYAQKGFFVMPSVQKSFARNLEATKKASFVKLMTDEIKDRKCRVVRPHISGDFYSAAYVDKWRQIIKACPETLFFAYTRSWRIPEINKALTKFVNSCPNLRMWYSIDAETGLPRNKPKRVRLAYMTVRPDDIPPHASDLVFRDYDIRKMPSKRLNGVLVCPPENGYTDITCTQCGICWRRIDGPTKKEPDAPIAKGRIALEMVA